MNALLLLPFAYFYTTRLSKGTLAFHALFEWVAAVWLVSIVGASSIAYGWLTMVLAYLAFISLYELGYMANDLHAALREPDGRRRGPQDASKHWVVSWVLVRIAAFFAITATLDQWHQSGWWLFFAAMAAVFTMHNRLDDREVKIATFAWLAWFRFMAPVMFVVQDTQRMGIGLAAAMGYVAFRQLGYLDSKGLLKMPGRQRPQFRRFFFLMPLVGFVAIAPYPEAQGYAWLTAYWAAVATLGTFFTTKKSSQPRESR